MLKVCTKIMQKCQLGFVLAVLLLSGVAFADERTMSVNVVPDEIEVFSSKNEEELVSETLKRENIEGKVEQKKDELEVTKKKESISDKFQIKHVVPPVQKDDNVSEEVKTELSVVEEENRAGENGSESVNNAHNVGSVEEVVFDGNKVDVKEEKSLDSVEKTVVPNKDDLKTKILLAYAKKLSKARDFVKNGNLKDAIAVYKELLRSKVLEVRIEALFQLGNIALNIGEIDIAIKYYETILNIDPNATRVRLDLARAYLVKEEWSKADYHFRMAALDEKLPPEVQMNIGSALYYIRQNKNWHFWFDFGAAPDDNVNNATEGEQCIATVFGVFCNKLPDKEKAKGFNVAFGGNHELKLSNHWRLRNEAMVWSSSYDKKKYDDLYVSYSFGPKYVWERGDIFVGPSAYRRWLGHRPYSYAVGGAFKANYDLTKHLSLGLNLSFMPTKYDKYPDELNGYTKGVSGSVFYGFDVAKYMVLRGGYSEEHTNDELYSNNRSFYAFGLGFDLFWGFSLYLEPSVQLTRYLKERWYVKDYEFQKIKEKSILRKYSASISNKKISLWGFIPTLTYTYMDKDSNVWQHEYEKENFEFTFQQRF